MSIRCFTKPVRPSYSGFKAKISRYSAIKDFNSEGWRSSRLVDVKSKGTVSSSPTGGGDCAGVSEVAITDIDAAEGVKVPTAVQR